jgi:gamma-glutamyltranspeptidase/glutathione hydrolase
VTAAAVLAVIEPSMNGIGGDLLALVYDAKTNRVYGLDSTGRSAHAATPAEYAKRGLTEMPSRGPLVVDVPGVVEGWHQLLSRFGTIDLGTALAPAIAFARDGFPVAELMANEWQNQEATLAADAATAATFLPKGAPPKLGEIFANPRLAKSLEAIAKEGRDAFYSGSIARAIVADIKARKRFARAERLRRSQGGLGRTDLDQLSRLRPAGDAAEHAGVRRARDAEHHGRLRHRGARPQLRRLPSCRERSQAHRIRGSRHLPRRSRSHAAGALQRLISKDYAASRRREINMSKAALNYAPDFAGVDRGDTIYLTAADGNGNVVSFIQSLFSSFGAGFRGRRYRHYAAQSRLGLHAAARSPERDRPHKRPLHTLVPAMLARNGRPIMAFGVMGGDNQAQAHAQIVANVVDFGMHVQEAGDAARVRHIGQELAVESGIGADVRRALEAKGHVVVDGRGAMGGYQAIWIDHETGVLLGGSDLRKDGLAIGW